MSIGKSQGFLYEKKCIFKKVIFGSFVPGHSCSPPPLCLQIFTPNDLKTS